MPSRDRAHPLDPFHPAVREWFTSVFPAPTPPQARGWPVIARGESMLLLSPTGSGKTLAAFLWCINRLMFDPVPATARRCRVLYVSPLKALAVDVERNLRAPIAGVTNVAIRSGVPHVVPAVAVRTGDTPAAERARFKRDPADILITTPESLYLLLTSASREALRAIDTVIVDEIHALVPTKRGAHLALSLERLEHLCGRPLQRVGLSATQRPLEEVARFLGGALTAPPASSAPPARRGARRHRGAGTATGREAPGANASAAGAPPTDNRAPQDELLLEISPTAAFRPVTIVDAGAKKALEVRIEVPVEDMARIGEPIPIPSGATSQGTARTTIWSAIQPRLLQLVRAHRSTLLFVNSRRIAERLASALNDLAGEPLVRAHHGSLARAQRVEIEDDLKAGRLRGLVATSSLELGIDMGAIDLVVQIEAPPSVASGLQRIGRASHQVDAVSRGIVFPKYRGDLVACAAVARAMQDGQVEATRYPRNPIDVLAQQVVAMAATETWDLDALFTTVRRAAPFASLSRSAFEGILDMLSGRYPSDDFAELRPRLTWDRVKGTVTAREGARRVAIVNGGTIPDRGLYGVFLAGAEGGAARVGELDEEMVFESRAGETFLLGASTWRIEEISHDRVTVSPAPGEPGKMPFWKGDGPGRPVEFGRAIGALVRTLAETPPAAAVDRLTRLHGLDPIAAENLLRYLEDQRAAARVLPDDRTIVIERCRDELGDWRVCLLSPLGGRVLTPWAMAAAAQIQDRTGIDVETMWTDDGFVVRFPETDEAPDVGLVLPAPDQVEDLVLRQLGATALFAAKFRECAARALLLPRRRPGGRTPLWQQRKRAHDLLQVASRYGSFPMLLEAYRECLRDQFDMPALVEVLRGVAQRTLRVATVDAATPSPFASSLLFGYVANYLYDGDAPLAERRAQALTIDQEQLRELLGDAELREVLDADVVDEVERDLQHVEGRGARSADSLHDLLLRVGDLSERELAARSADGSGRAWAEALVAGRRALWLPVAAETRLVAVEDASRFRDALGTPLPPGLPESLLAPVHDPMGDLASRHARTHAPFTAADFASRFGLAPARAERTLHRLAASGRLIEGEFRPGGTRREWCDPGVLATIRRRSLAKLRREVAPVEPRVLGRFVTVWHGVTSPRRGLDALLDAIEQLQGAPLAASILEREILPSRISGYRPEDLDTLVAAGEVVWVGIESLGERDGRVALFLADHLPRLLVALPLPDALDTRERAILEVLRRCGATFFAPLHEAAGGGYPQDTVDALWNLVWRGLVTNDSLHALRAFVRPPGRARRSAAPATRGFRSRRTAPAAAHGRWALVPPVPAGRTVTEHRTSLAQQLLARHGFVTREVVAAEGLAGGFAGLYDVFQRMEERGRLRRGYFTLGVGATQFAQPAALELLRSLRSDPDEDEVVHVAATDPANPYGSILKWPAPDSTLAGASRGPTRSVGASVVLVNGRLGAFVARGGRAVFAYLPDNEPERSRAGRAIASRLAAAATGDAAAGGLLVSEINGAPAASHPLGRYLVNAGFAATALGYLRPRQRPSSAAAQGVPADATAEASEGGQPADVVPGEPPAGEGTLQSSRRRTRRALVSSPFAALRGK
jgi:ATP-dependent Lhr-like helicase